MVLDWNPPSPAKLRCTCLIVPVVLRAGKRGKEGVVNDLGRLYRKEEARRSWNIDFSSQRWNSGEIGNRAFRDLEIVIFGKTERGRCGSIYGGVFVA
jgi:hypothetical protein